MSNLRYSESVVVGRTPEDVYDMVSDVTRMGEWSPVCRACWWDDGDGPRPGAWFTGRNELPERTWETRSQVVAADRGREFAFVVGGAWVRWGYTFTPVDGGTRSPSPGSSCPTASPGSTTGSVTTPRRRSPSAPRPRGAASRSRSPRSSRPPKQADAHLVIVTGTPASAPLIT